MKRITIGAIIALALSAFVYFVLINAEAYVLYEKLEVQPEGKLKLDVWINDFYNAAFASIILGLIGVLIWYFIGYFRYRITHWKNAGGFLMWAAIGLLILSVMVIYGLYILPKAIGYGREFALIFCGANTWLIYWFTTALFSPSTVKYEPFGALSFRMARAGNLLVNLLK